MTYCVFIQKKCKQLLAADVRDAVVITHAQSPYDDIPILHAAHIDEDYTGDFKFKGDCDLGICDGVNMSGDFSHNPDATPQAHVKNDNVDIKDSGGNCNIDVQSGDILSGDFRTNKIRHCVKT